MDPRGLAISSSRIEFRNPYRTTDLKEPIAPSGGGEARLPQNERENSTFTGNTGPAEGTGWIAPEVPPSELPSLQDAVPTAVTPRPDQATTPTRDTGSTEATGTSSAPETHRAGPTDQTEVTTTSSDQMTGRTDLSPGRAGSSAPSDRPSDRTGDQPGDRATYPPTDGPTTGSLSFDRAAILRDIRNRARLGSDGTGTWSGHTGSIPVGPTTGESADGDGEKPEDHGKPPTGGPGSIVQALRDPYEPAPRTAPFTSGDGPGPSAGPSQGADSPQHPDGDEPAGGR